MEAFTDTLNSLVYFNTLTTMLDLTNKKVIDAVVANINETTQAGDLYAAVRMQIDFLEKEIIFRDINNVCIGRYNLLPNRRRAIENCINNL